MYMCSNYAKVSKTCAPSPTFAKTRLQVLCSLFWGGMAGYGDQDNRQDFYESGYDMDGVQQEQQAPPPAVQQGGWQQIPAQDQQAQWGSQQQVYYPPIVGYVQQQGYGPQGGRRSVHCSPYTRTICHFYLEPSSIMYT